MIRYCKETAVEPLLSSLKTAFSANFFFVMLFLAELGIFESIEKKISVGAAVFSSFLHSYKLFLI